MKASRGAWLRPLILAIDLDVSDVPALAAGIHLHRDRGAGCDAGREQLLWTRALVGAAVLGGLVCGYLMVADFDPMGEASIGTSRGGLHCKLLSLKGESSSR